MPSSKVKVSIAKVLQDEGYISAYNVSEDEGKASLSISLKYFEGKPVISKLDRISRPSLRVYKSATEIPVVIGGLGVAIISTSQGVMAGRKAKALGQGGEILCAVS